jgi:hypothetical protein
MFSVCLFQWLYRYVKLFYTLEVLSLKYAGQASMLEGIANHLAILSVQKPHSRPYG